MSFWPFKKKKVEETPPKKYYWLIRVWTKDSPEPEIGYNVGGGFINRYLPPTVEFYKELPPKMETLVAIPFELVERIEREQIWEDEENEEV